MIQAPIPPDFIPAPFNWFQFAMLYSPFVVLVWLVLPERWQRKVSCALFRTSNSR
jgi:hypothetical protein